MWLAGNQNRAAWMLGLLNQAFWLMFIVMYEAWGLLPLAVALTFVYGVTPSNTLIREEFGLFQ